MKAHAFLRFFRRDRPLVYGHRGTCLGATENTLFAMQRALSQGADGIELDVRPCKSGEVIVLHDPDLLRVAGAPVRADAATFAELRAHDLGNGERVPRLVDAIDLVLSFGPNILLNVELKPNVPDRLALARAVAESILARSPAERARVVVSSFSVKVCEAMVGLLPEVPVAFLYELPPERLPRGIAGIHPPHALVSPAETLELHARSLFTNAWTVNDAALARSLAHAGVDGLITDDVPRVLGALATNDAV